MTTAQNVETLISSLEDAVKAAFAYFESNSEAEHRVGMWTPREVLCHMIYWHQATVEGMESVASGGDAHRIFASTDEMNARAVGRNAGQSMGALIEQAQGWQDKLATAARSMSDASAVVLVRGDGTELTAAQRLEHIATHWNGHIQELKDAE